MNFLINLIKKGFGKLNSVLPETLKFYYSFLFFTDTAYSKSIALRSSRSYGVC